MYSYKLILAAMYLWRVGIDGHSYVAACLADELRIKLKRAVSREINRGGAALIRRVRIDGNSDAAAPTRGSTVVAPLAPVRLSPPEPDFARKRSGAQE